VAAQHTRALSEIAANADKVNTIRDRRQRFIGKLETQIASLHLIVSQRLESKADNTVDLNHRAMAAIDRAHVLITDVLKQDTAGLDTPGADHGGVILPTSVHPPPTFTCMPF
jgi:hypothetical protein